jgi:hypothetical protein
MKSLLLDKHLECVYLKRKPNNLSLLDSMKTVRELMLHKRECFTQSLSVKKSNVKLKKKMNRKKHSSMVPNRVRDSLLIRIGSMKER